MTKYCTTNINLYPNVIMEDALLSSSQVREIGMNLKPVKTIVATNDPEVMAKSNDYVKIEEYIENADQWENWMISHYPACYLGCSVSIRDENKVVFSMDTPLVMTSGEEKDYYLNNDKKTVVYLSGWQSPDWCSEKERYDWAVRFANSRDSITATVPPFKTMLQDYGPVVDKTKALPEAENDYMQRLAIDEYLGKQGFGQVNKTFAMEAVNETHYKLVSAEDMYEQSQATPIPESIDDRNINYRSSQSDYEKELFGEDDEDPFDL